MIGDLNIIIVKMMDGYPNRAEACNQAYAEYAIIPNESGTGKSVKLSMNITYLPFATSLSPLSDII